MRKALALSFAAHGMLFGAFVPLAHRSVRPAPALLPPEDRWTGTTAELPGAGGAAGPLVDVSVDSKPAAPEPPAPASPPPAAKEPAAKEPAAKEPAVDMPPPPPKEPAAPREPAIEKPRPKPRVEKPRVEKPKVEPPAEAKHDAAERPSAEPSSSDPPARPAAPKKPRGVASNADHGASPGGNATGSFGSEGPASVRDLGRALTRAIPPACDADPVWGTLPIGDAGKLEVAVRIDGDGHIASAEPRGAVQPKALLNVLRRTIPLLQAGTFAVREGGTSEGTEILELGASVSEAPAPDDAPAAPNQLAFEYARGKGKARFTQSSGRHVEIFVRVVRIEAGR